MRGLYAIVDVPLPGSLGVGAMTRALVAGGHAGAVQLRAKTATTDERIRLLEEMGPICVAAGVPLLVNDDVDAALAGAPGVSGVHLGQGDPGSEDVAGLRERARAAGREQFLVGLSTHSIDQLRQACHRGPDYVAFGPVLPTRSKDRPDPTVGMTGLLEACRQSWKPLVAIGGLNAHTGAAAVQAGADAVAVIGALRSPDVAVVRERARELAETLRRAARPLDLDAVAEQVPVLERAQLVELARWADDVGTHITLGLPARFRPIVDGEAVWYRPCDLLDLLHVLGKRREESWDEWNLRRTSSTADPGTFPPGQLVQLRRPDGSGE